MDGSEKKYEIFIEIDLGLGFSYGASGFSFGLLVCAPADVNTVKSRRENRTSRARTYSYKVRGGKLKLNRRARKMIQRE